ncbi:MAG TPA: rhodanese-like domain-containing protein [Thermoanaerobaculia bacterium]|nr:rhodanese-like domain-containing protein [Thermoanaerobaculia bacterium]
MNPRVVYTAGGIAAAALVVFAIWHAQRRGHAAQPPVVPHEETASAPRIDPDELLAHFKAGDVTIIDVRDGDSYLASHIPGALHIPLARVQSEVPSLPKAKPIVAYCT